MKLTNRTGMGAAVEKYMAGDRLWPRGDTRLNVYFLPKANEIKPLVDLYRPEIERYDFLAPVPDEWLHVTIKAIDDPPVREIATDQLVAIEGEIRAQFSRIQPFTLTTNGLVSGEVAVMFDLVPDHKFVEVAKQIQAVFSSVLGHGVKHYPTKRPHMALAYAKGNGDSGLVASKLRRITDQRATLTVSEVCLADVMQNAELTQFRWEEIARIPLGC